MAHREKTNPSIAPLPQEPAETLIHHFIFPTNAVVRRQRLRHSSSLLRHHHHRHTTGLNPSDVDTMLQAQHIFSHQHQYPHSEPWIHQQQAQQAQQHSHQAAQVQAQVQAQAQAQAQAAAAAAAAAQQQHYNRIAANVSSRNLHADHVGQGSMTLENGISEENRRVLGWIAELMNGDSREAALLELSKKREQVPELALILWHSFGQSRTTFCAQDR